MNKWNKAVGFNPDGSVTFKYQVRVQNNSAVDSICGLELNEFLNEPGFLQGSTLCSAVQGATFSSPGGWFNPGGDANWNGDNVTNFSIQGPSGPGGLTNCLRPGQHVNVCFTVKTDGSGLPNFPGPADNVVNQANTSGTIIGGATLTDESNNMVASNGFPADGDNPTVVSVQETCVYPGFSKELTEGPDTDGDCNYTTVWTYVMCNYNEAPADACAQGGVEACTATNIDVFDFNGVINGVNDGPVTTNFIDYIPGEGLSLIHI